MLRIYAEVLDLGRTPGSVGAEVGEFNGLSSVLDEWITSGTIRGSRPEVPPQILAEADTERAERLGALVRDAMRDYGRHAEAELQAGRMGPENSWLGVASLIQEELHRLANALSDRARSSVPSF